MWETAVNGLGMIRADLQSVQVGGVSLDLLLQVALTLVGAWRVGLGSARGASSLCAVAAALAARLWPRGDPLMRGLLAELRDPDAEWRPENAQLVTYNVGFQLKGRWDHDIVRALREGRDILPALTPKERARLNREVKFAVRRAEEKARLAYRAGVVKPEFDPVEKGA